ncbi:Lrp/AsnC family transcriptional regulator [Georgenia sp. AZ-5]|uniref:Lrp/AsnC family transcriptional regulator n=1 Tax=Georgenia sp. AZ-5 TaxID=3367526 RepID=UPI003755289F
MLTAIVLIDADVAKIPEVAQEVADLDGISEVYSVTGDVDLVAIARVREHEDLAKVVADQLGKVDGVVGTKTYIAFQAYSQHDLEQAFHIGLD